MDLWPHSHSFDRKISFSLYLFVDSLGTSLGLHKLYCSDALPIFDQFCTNHSADLVIVANIYQLTVTISSVTPFYPQIGSAWIGFRETLVTEITKIWTIILSPYSFLIKYLFVNPIILTVQVSNQTEQFPNILFQLNSPFAF